MRSSRTSIAPPRLSTAWSISFCTRSNAVSVLCNCLQAAWNTSCRPFWSRWLTNCTHNMRSIDLERNDRLEIGLQLLVISASSMIFLIKGVRDALLRSLGNPAYDRDVFNINVSTAINSSSHFLSSHVGIGSRAHYFFCNDWILFLISSSDTSVNESSTSPSNLLKLSHQCGCIFQPMTFSAVRHGVCCNKASMQLATAIKQNRRIILLRKEFDFQQHKSPKCLKAM